MTQPPESPRPPLDLQELEELVAKASPGPWTTNNYGTLAIIDAKGWRVAQVGAPSEEAYIANAGLIAAARNALPALLARVRDLEEENRQLRDTLQDSVAWAQTCFENVKRLQAELEAEDTEDLASISDAEANRDKAVPWSDVKAKAQAAHDQGSPT